MENQSKLSNWRITLPLIVLLVATLFSIAAIVLFSISQVNEESRLTTERYIAAVIDDKLQQQGILSMDYAYWDATIENAYLSKDDEWIAENIGAYLTDTFNITDLFILDGDSKPVLSLIDGEEDLANYLTIEELAFTELVNRARMSPPEPQSVSGILLIDGTPALVGMTVLTWEYQDPFPAPRPVLVIATRLDAANLGNIARQYRLNDLRFTSETENIADFSSIPIKNPQHEPLGMLIWQTDKPGDLLLGNMILPLSILVIAIIIVTAFIIYASRNTIHRLNQAYADLHHNANHDALTGLANRRLFNELLIQTIHAVRRDKISCAMLYIDLDDFKNVNDAYGHKAGDQFLITIAERLKSSVRESDTTARVGGDEFIVLLHNIRSREDIIASAQKIISNLAQPTGFLNEQALVSASIGVTMIPADGMEPDVLMSKADIAMYECKKKGKNAFLFYADASL